LVYGLKLPLEFLQVDPRDIPTIIDDPVPLSLRVCGLKDPVKTATISSLEKNLEAAEADFRAAKNNSLPELKLSAGYIGNGIGSSGSQTMQDVLNGRKEDSNQNLGLGPTWNVGVSLAWPLDNSLARSDRTRKFLSKEKIASQLQIENDSLKSNWRELCRKLKVEKRNERTYKNVVSQQRKRAKAENRRFSLGRITVDQLVTAEDDLGNWEFMSHQKSIEVRQLAWNVQQVSGEMYRRIQPAIEARRMEESQ
ncbi:MAG: TolC family protein, partial [Bdellovibrionales bacterium]|nr:TolC family protein [Bdellovibrionales bacterium]